jgi:WD40 repeat protein/energy-coupling factor transporter ATP-binding protein EcfA2
MSQIVDEMPDTPSTVVTGNPFPGLRPFKIEESHLFFGREGQSDEVLLKLSKSRFVGVIGPSGSGKSSFIYCGVLPILYGGFLTDASPNWEVVVTRPGAGPIDNLAESLLKSSREYNAADTEDKKIKRTIVSTLLRSSSLGLVEAIQQSRRSEDINYLILVDQFEELFRFKDSTDPGSVDETLAFVNLLMEAINYTDAPIYVGITMRSDFIGDCAQFPELTRKINDSHYLIPQMTREQKRRAVEGPVAVGGAHISPRLVQQLLNDLGDNPDQLPILQHALMRTWSYWTQYKDYEDELLDLKHYEAIGTMTEALSQHANEAYDELDDEQKRICEILFKAITEKRGENFGIRRPTRLNEIAAIADVSEDDVSGVIEKFREQGRSLLTPAYGTPLGSKSMIDISHESLMRIWVRLKNWVDDEADAVQMYQRLAEAAAQYQVGKAGLWRPPDLQLALNWQAKHKPTLVWGQRYHPAFERTMIFLEYSKKEFETEQRIKELEAKRRLQRARSVALVLGGFLVLALLSLVYAIVQQTKAQKAEQEAIAQKNRAVGLQKLADKNAQSAKDEAAAAKIARDQAIAAQKEADIQRIAAENAKKEAEAALVRANIAEADATAQKNAAVKARDAATQSEKQARIAEAAAQKARYVAQAKAMAVKSKELDNDPEQEALIAQQAYLFNNTYGDYAYDNDIYNGLYFALKNQKPEPDPITKNLEGHEKGAARALVTVTKSNRIYSGGSDGRIIRWTYQTDHWVAEVLVSGPDNTPRADYQIYAMDVSPDENWLVAGGASLGDATQNYVELYNLGNMTSPPKRIPGFVQNVEHVEFSPDGKGFYARDNSGHSIRYSDLTSANEVINTKDKINAIALSPDGSKLAGAGDNGVLYIWNLKNNYSVKEAFRNNTISTTGTPVGLTALTYAPDNRHIIIGDDNGQVRSVLEDSTVPAKILSGHRAHIEQIKFNNKGDFFATASWDFTVRLWNWKDLDKQPMVLSDHADWVWSAAFTPDDQQLMVGIHSNNNKAKETIFVWPTQIKAMTGLLCKYVKRNLDKEEWNAFVGSDLTYEKTCSNYPENNK